jgi:hypothetical protein
MIIDSICVGVVVGVGVVGVVDYWFLLMIMVMITLYYRC